MGVSPNAQVRPLRSRELAERWEEGEHGVVIRAILESWDHAVRADDLAWVQEPLRRVGLPAESFALQVITARRRTDPRLWEGLIRAVLTTGDPWWAQELLLEAGRSTRSLQALGIEVDLAHGDASAAIAAWVSQYADIAARDAAVGWWLRAGRLEEVERLVDNTPELVVWRARLALYRNDPATARRLLQQAPPAAETRCLEAIAAVLENRLEDAERLLRPLLDSEAYVEAWSWLTTVLRKQRRYDEALEAADVAKSASPEFNLELWVERWLVAYEQEIVRSGKKRASTLTRIMRSLGLAPPEMELKVARIEQAWAIDLLGVKPEEPVSALEGLIERFAGNHTPHITMVRNGRLERHVLPVEGGELGSAIQLVLRTRGVDAVRDLYRELLPQMTRFPRFRLYQGEVELWVGAYAEAAEIFSGILAENRTVKWAWIGLGASAMLQGELDRAQGIWAEALDAIAPAPFDGPTIFIYRGECHRRQGHADLARADLEFAARQKPNRVSTWINLALLDGGAELRHRVREQCYEHAPLLMEELGRHSDDPAVQLELVLEAMRGNRSSTRASYFLWDRLWHFIPHGMEALLPLLSRTA